MQNLCQGQQFSNGKVYLFLHFIFFWVRGAVRYYVVFLCFSTFYFLVGLWWWKDEEGSRSVVANSATWVAVIPGWPVPLLRPLPQHPRLASILEPCLLESTSLPLVQPASFSSVEPLFSRYPYHPHLLQWRSVSTDMGHVSCDSFVALSGTWVSPPCPPVSRSPRFPAEGAYSSARNTSFSTSPPPPSN